MDRLSTAKRGWKNIQRTVSFQLAPEEPEPEPEETEKSEDDLGVEIEIDLPELPDVNSPTRRVTRQRPESPVHRPSSPSRAAEDALLRAAKDSPLYAVLKPV